MALMRLCRCGKKIDYKNKYCPECSVIVQKDKKKRNKEYDENRKHVKYWNFYRSKPWLRLRESVLSHYNYIDLWQYYQEGKVKPANTSHHIVEIRDDWDMRLDFNNQFPCSDSSHSLIHKLYLNDKKGTQRLLRELLKRWKDDIGNNSQ